MFNVNLLATLSVLSKQVGERPSIALSLSRVVVVGPWIHRNRVTFAVPWPKRRPTWLGKTDVALARPTAHGRLTRRHFWREPDPWPRI